MGGAITGILTDADLRGASADEALMNEAEIAYPWTALEE